MTRLTATFAVLLAASLLGGCHHQYQTYDGAYVTEYEEEDVTYWHDEDQMPATVYSADQADGYWDDSSSVVTEPVQDDSYYTYPAYDSSAYMPAPSLSIPAPRYSSGYRPYIAPTIAVPSYRPFVPAWQYAPPPVSATIRTPPPVLIRPVRFCPCPY